MNLNHKSDHKSLETFEKSKNKPVPWKVQPLQPKQKLPDCVKSQHENHSHSRDTSTWLPWQCC